MEPQFDILNEPQKNDSNKKHATYGGTSNTLIVDEELTAEHIALDHLARILVDILYDVCE